MSAFLGPIHFWLYNKITTENKLVDEYLQFAASIGMNELKQQVDETYGVLPQESLEEIIDESNIHGWLQEKVSMVERRLAMVVTKIVEKTNDREKLLSVAFEFGKKHSMQTAKTPQDAYKYLNDILVDGMPCDHVNMLVCQNEYEVIWKRTQCVHARYWEEVAGIVDLYYDIRNEWIAGMLVGSDLFYEELEDACYRISLK